MTRYSGSVFPYVNVEEDRQEHREVAELLKREIDWAKHCFFIQCASHN
jgi:hypothetical protein